MKSLWECTLHFGQTVKHTSYNFIMVCNQLENFNEISFIFRSFIFSVPMKCNSLIATQQQNFAECFNVGLILLYLFLPIPTSDQQPMLPFC